MRSILCASKEHLNHFPLSRSSLFLSVFNEYNFQIDKLLPRITIGARRIGARSALVCSGLARVRGKLLLFNRLLTIYIMNVAN